MSEVFDMTSDEFVEFLEDAVEEEAEMLFGPVVDSAYSRIYDDAAMEIEDELKSHVDIAGLSSITESEARECIRTGLMQCKQRWDDESEREVYGD